MYVCLTLSIYSGPISEAAFPPPSQERDSDRERLQELMEENAQLHLSTKNSLSESATLVAQLDHLKSQQQVNGTNVGNELIGDAQTRVLKLQLENQRLEAELEQMKRDSFMGSVDKLLELEKENKRLSLKVNESATVALYSPLTWHISSTTLCCNGFHCPPLRKLTIFFSGDFKRFPSVP